MPNPKPMFLMFGRTALGVNVPVRVDAAGLLAGGGNPFDQDLNTTDEVEFAKVVSPDIEASNLTSGKIPIASTGGKLIDGQTPLAGTKVYYVSDTSGGAVTRKLTFTNGILTSET